MCCAPAAPCTSSSTASRLTSPWPAGRHRLEPLQKRLFGGCHLTRRIVDVVEGSGFTIKEIETFYEEGAPKVLGADSLGVAAS